MARRHKLNVRKVEGVIARGEVGRYGDGGGLVLEVTGPGAASWCYRYQLDGRKRTMGLGSASVFDLPAARERAQAQRVLRADGVDPLAARQGERARRQREANERTKAKSFAEVGRMLYDKNAGTWAKQHREAWLSSVLSVRPSGKKARGHCESLLRLPVGDIDKSAVVACIKPLWTRSPVTAGRVLSRIHAVIAHAIAFDLRPEGSNPADAEVIAKLMPAVDHKKRPLAAVPYSEIAELYARIAAVGTSPARALQFQILCAVRPLEAYGALWSETDLAARTWTIGASRMKGRVAHVVPLSDQAMALLQALPREAGNDVVFISSRPGRIMASNGVIKVMKALGRRETCHGHRSAFSTWASEQSNFPDSVIEATLAHALPNEVLASYKRDFGAGFLVERRRELLAAWGAFVAPRTGDDKVTTLRTGARV